ncbi:hypothetical protein [Microbacterium sp.]|uniref:hypothetical protein n=1 Tax=Microbacterium sp. TaxID=51671 RepID=UPI0039E4288E
MPGIHEDITTAFGETHPVRPHAHTAGTDAEVLAHRRDLVPDAGERHLSTALYAHLQEEATK